jgi:V/A-type H+/Na+-transporting ATPase subunit A
MLTIVKILGPLVTAKILDQAENAPMMLETVYVGKSRLLGEVISIEGNEVQIQVYEDTTGIEIGEPVELRGELLSVELGPGILGNMFDGIQRPLEDIDKVSPIFISPGIHLPSLNRDKEWDFIPTVQVGEEVREGSKIGFVQETSLIKHWILTPKGINGTVKKIEAGAFKLDSPIAEIELSDGSLREVKMYQKWPVKIPREIQEKLTPKALFKTGQRIIDAMFPVLLGARVVTPGPFGAGKTFTQQQTAKWSDAELVVYVGCGERGNEMTEMVKSFPELTDPRSGKPLMDRTVLIANTSNMPIAAREASIYTGITIAEYFRDMGYNVVLMADSTSRWAEAMREISQRMSEMPSEEGYPAYLSSRMSSFYERAGLVKTVGQEEGSVTVVGTVSPPGGDFSEPITQNSLKNAQVFLALDAGLAAQRHYPAINWNTSYSLYEDAFNNLLTNDTEESRKFAEDRKLAKRVLSQEGDLLDLVKLVGMDGLDNDKRVIIEIAKSLREDFLQQNGFDPIDTYCSFDKMMAMLSVIMDLYREVNEVLKDEDKKNEEDLVARIFDAKTKTDLSNLKYKESVEEIKQVGLKLLEKVKDS